MSIKKIKYRINNTIDFILYDIPNFFRNVWTFRKELTGYKPWDYTHNLSLLKKSIEDSYLYLEKYGHQEDETRYKKIYYMKRSVYLMDLIINDSFSELAENELGIHHSINGFEFDEVIENGSKSYKMNDVRSSQEKTDDDIIIKRTNLIEKETWKELFDILGNDKGGKGIFNWWD